jgi:hypothetical protein
MFLAVMKIQGSAQMRRGHSVAISGHWDNLAGPYAGSVPKLLEEVYRLQRDLQVDDDERLLLKMFANLLESHYEVKEPRNQLTFEEYEKVPGRWELLDGMLANY